MEQETQEEKKKITKHQFFFETSLYEVILKQDLEIAFSDFFSGVVDAYGNGIETTYEINRESMRKSTYSGLSGFDDFYGIRLICKRKGDTLYFFVANAGDYVVKVGQVPSLADLQFTEMGKKYDKVLPKPELRDFKKAIGLSAHGAGAGSLVYLRRIFENIIWETYRKNASVLQISEVDFQKKRMDEKVTALASFLPEQLVEMKGVYTILSKGIHELSEEECLAYFPALKLSIELILDQKIENEAKEQKEHSVKKALADILQKVNGK